MGYIATFSLTDNDMKFVNKMLQSFTEERHIPYYRSAVSSANPVKRVNRVLKTMIVAFLDCNHREWDPHLKEFRGTIPPIIRWSALHLLFLNLGRELEPAHSLRWRCQGATEVEPRDPARWSAC